MTLASRMSVLGTETAFEVFAKAKALEAKGKDIIHLHIGAPDFSTPENIVEAGRKALTDGWHKYTPAKGLPELREAVAENILSFRGAEIDPNNVLIVPGGKPTMFYAIMMFGEAGKEIIYPNPGFPIYESMIHWSGAKAVPYGLEEEKGFAFSAEAVLALITPATSLLIVNTPANPTGGIVPRSEMDKLVAGLEKHPHVTVLCDEIYSRQLYDGEEHVSILQYPSMIDRSILLDGWSKTYAMTGWRLGYGVWPSHLIADAERIQINSSSCANAVTQVAAIEALRGPQTAVDEMLASFDERRKIIHEELNAIPGFRCVMPKGAFYAFPNTSGTGIASKTLEDELLNEAGVACLSGKSFGKFGEGYMRFSYANSADNIREGLRRVREHLANRQA
ncbi:Putative N-acetyl-LL-diaminopimelate aminotransferase [Planctomycetes bacterium Poly30]|uniref:N-acetyl-LL-diaminopimelate aminotransferase n=1 Tax=Saltatorellus ferox TaxID=2528018 RepID=A0A518ESP4_9BACT|nr:Putative N-acetyl-LL-diaminopimelate aminotransferase [Planctomycetes bacterium Poly30]